jgi:class 3 adenylate cyclase
LKAQVTNIFRDTWTTREGYVVPDPADLQLGNDAVYFDRATVLYADLSQSTILVDSKTWWFAAEVYKTYLHCAARLIREEGGEIVSYDGDRVMGIFIGSTQSNSAVRCGLKINYAVKSIINPALKTKYPDETYSVKHVVGIDTSKIHAARTGVRGDNDIVWVGRAANYAAKLCDLSNETPTWITHEVFTDLKDDTKYGGNPKQLMWKEWTWNTNNNHKIHSSNYTWRV